MIAGDRDTTCDWTTEFYMDTDMMILNALQRWNNGINDFDEFQESLKLVAALE